MTQMNELKKEWTDNRSTWTGPNGKPKIKIILITNLLTVDSLTLMKQNFDEFAKEIWNIPKEDNFCQLLGNVPTEKLGTAMIEQFEKS